MKRGHPCLCARHRVFLTSAAGRHPTKNEAAPPLAPAQSPARGHVQAQPLQVSASLSPALPSALDPTVRGGIVERPRVQRPNGVPRHAEGTRPAAQTRNPRGTLPSPLIRPHRPNLLPTSSREGLLPAPHRPHLGPLGASALAAPLAQNTRPAVLNVNCLPSGKPGQRRQSSALTPARMFPGLDLQSPATHPKQRGQSVL